MRDRAVTLSLLGRTPSAQMTWTKNPTRATPILVLLRDGQGSRPSQLRLETNYNEPHHRNEPGGGAGGALGQRKSFRESTWGTKDSQGNSIRVDLLLGKPRKTDEPGENQTVTEEVKHFVPAGNHNMGYIVH